MTLLFLLCIFCAKCTGETVITHTKSLVQANSSKITFGSCSYPGKNTEIFDTIAARHSDIFIWMGDATYLDYKSYDPANTWKLLGNNWFGIDPAPTSEWEHTWNIAKSDKNYQKLLKTGVKIIGVYDDHDYGLNDGDGLNNAQHKDYAQELFLNFLDTPLNDSKRQEKRIYDHVKYEMNFNVNQKKLKNITKIIDIILLDTRYFAKVDGDENILGNDQWQWFENIIKTQTNGELTMIVTAIQSIPVSRDKDNWNKYAKSRNDFFDLLINHNKNKRVIILSGDIHFAEILQMQCIDIDREDNKQLKQNIYEITSSSLTHAIGDVASFLYRIYYQLKNYLLYDGVYRCRYTGRNFGELNINWLWNDNLQDIEIENVTTSIVDIDGNEQCFLNLPLWNENDDIQIDYDANGVSLWNYNNYTCFGGIKQHTMDEVNAKSFKKSLYYVQSYGVLGVLVIYTIIMVFVKIFKKIKWCERCTKWVDNANNIDE